MKKDSMSMKILSIGFVGGVCLIASMFVLGLVQERENRHNEVKQEIGSTWGTPQTIIGPALVFKDAVNGDVYVLPHTLSIESSLVPETRARGMFETVVYTEHIVVEGTFSNDDMPLSMKNTLPVFAVSLSDTRSIETQVPLTWQKKEVPFQPGTNAPLFASSGMHAMVPIASDNEDHSFSFALTLKGSGERLFAPVGRETKVNITGNWDAPVFVGGFLPTSRTLESELFSAQWKISSFGRNYPQTFVDDTSVTFPQLTASTFGVRLGDGVDLYTQVERSTKYAILFILVTFIVFFLFEILTHRVLHALHYLLIGSALSLFYLLLLSLAEHIGFLRAYITATILTISLITLYSTKILKSGIRALWVSVALLGLYGYLYFVLSLEDYALICGSVLLFILLSSVMYLTRNIEWNDARQTDV